MNIDACKISQSYTNLLVNVMINDSKYILEIAMFSNTGWLKDNSPLPTSPSVSEKSKCNKTTRQNFWIIGCQT